MNNYAEHVTVQETTPVGRIEQAAYGVKQHLPRRLRQILSLADFEAAARRVLPRPLFGYISGAAEDGMSIAANRAAFEHLKFRTKVLVDVSRRSQQTTIFNHTYSSPFGIAPVGISAISAYRGDIALAAAAKDENIPAIMSGSSLIPMETVHAEAPGTWFQAYLPGDAARRDALIERVKAAGFATLVLTVDIPVWANRENNVRTGFSLPLRPSLRLAMDGISHPRWLLGTFARTLINHGMPHFENSFATRGAPMLSASAIRDTTGRDHLSWSDIASIRQRWSGNLVIKGILHADDARRALAIGADGIIVSNHGGRQLDGAVEPLAVLPQICDAVGDKTVVMMDSGIRRGGDVLKALALGAQFVFAGRPFMYAAAVGGAPGVRHAIGLLRDEVDRNMAMLGTVAIREIDRAILA
ncbi:alpha-hydroxy acid oxidase [Paraburkholderia sp. EG287B]|uniref:alpha-hydroxy acid oxidase n=1 Tax=Paraburkholderia sp. EG287B TaxID=3237010 RepID=UPI0034D21CA8